jgi:DNA-binding NtrC family response regulator
MIRPILVADREAAHGRRLVRALEGAYECRLVGTSPLAFAAICTAGWAAAIVGHELDDGGSGVEVLQMLRHGNPRTFRLLHTPQSSGYVLQDLLRFGDPHALFDTGDPGCVDAVRCRLDELFEDGPLEAPDRFEPLNVRASWSAYSPVSRAFLERLHAAAGSDAPVYLHGEPGAGSERASFMLRRLREERRANGRTGRAHGPIPDPVVVLRVPSLRERLQDIPTLAQRCLAEHAAITGEPVRTLSPEAVAALLEREWRGNAIELRGTLVRACQRAGTRTPLTAADLPSDRDPAWRATQVAKDDGQRECVLRQLRACRSVTRAAESEGATRANYIRMMRRLGIVRADVHNEADEDPD